MNLTDIQDFNAPEMDFFARATERQLREEGMFLTESANVSLRALEAGYEPVSMLVENGRMDVEAGPVIDEIEKRFGREMLDSIPVYTADREVVINMTGHKLVRGLWTLYKRKTENNVNDFLKDKRRIAVLVDVVNPVNVGAIFRSAAALGMDGVLLTHSSVDPLTRRTARVSMGTVFQIPWAQASLEDSEYSVLMKLIGSYGYKTVAMALTDDSVSVDNDEIRANERIAVLLGTEGTGLPKEIIDTSDYRVRIPMFHGVDSLNVAAASAVSFWELTKNGSVSI